MLERAFLLLRAHPGHVFVFLFLAQRLPLFAHQPDAIMAKISIKHKHFSLCSPTLVLNMKVCLNTSVQKHTRIKAKGGRLPLVGKLSSSQKSQKRSI